MMPHYFCLVLSKSFQVWPHPARKTVFSLLLYFKTGSPVAQASPELSMQFPWPRLALSSACSGVGLELELLLLPPPEWCDHRVLSPQLAKKSDPHRENPERSLGLRWRRS